SSTGLVTWQFTSLDPKTRELPEDPLAGFLPPNVRPPEGDGSVSFTVARKALVPSGTQVCNQASIVFDANEAILTPLWCNTVDDVNPSSLMSALSETVPPDFRVQWSGTDQGSGIHDFSIFVSENNGPFERWLTEVSAATATYHGKIGSSYSFYSVARDNAG